MRTGYVRRSVGALAVMLTLWGYAWGCTSPPDNPPDTNTTTVGMPPPGLPFVPPDPSTGRVGVYVGLPVNLFAPQVPTTWVCGHGLGTTGSNVPGSLTIDGVAISVYNTTQGFHRLIPNFLPLHANDVSTSGLANGPVVFPDAVWQGFAGQIQPFDPPQPGPDEVLMMTFALSVDQGDLTALEGQPVQFAGGSGQDDGTPNFDGEHPVNYWNANDPALHLGQWTGETLLSTFSADATQEVSVTCSGGWGCAMQAVAQDNRMPQCGAQWSGGGVGASGHAAVEEQAGTFGKFSACIPQSALP